MSTAKPGQGVAPATFRILFLLGVLAFSVSPVLDDVSTVLEARSVLPWDRVVAALRVSLELNRFAVFAHLVAVLVGAGLAVWQSFYEDARTFIIAPLIAGVMAGLSGLVSLTVTPTHSSEITQALLVVFEREPLLHTLAHHFGRQGPDEIAVAIAGFLGLTVFGLRIQRAFEAAAAEQEQARSKRPADWRK